VSEFLVGNAPVSWGVYTAAPPGAANPPFGAVLDAIAHAGYDGSELGPYGYFPTTPSVLAGELARRKLRLASSYVAFPLDDPAAVATALPAFHAVCALLSAFGVPYVMVAADATPTREALAGSVPPDGSGGWNGAAWARVAESMAQITAAVRTWEGLRIAFHHEASSPVETEDEIDRLLAITDPEMVGLCLDTGHLIYGGGDPVAAIPRWADRIWYVHLKDVWPDKLARIRRERIPAPEAWALSIFAGLGEGCARVPHIVEALQRSGYGGWLIVEQDVVLDEEDQSRGLAHATTAAGASRAFLRTNFGI
jgi:inosose dehydratase